MGQQVIKQPDGLFALFDTRVDHVTVWDATRDEMIDHLADEACQRTRLAIRKLVDEVAEGVAQYRGRALTWDQAVARDADHDGDLSRALAVQARAVTP